MKINNTLEFVFNQERDSAINRQRELEHEIELLKERLDASQRAWSATKRELDERESRFSAADREIRDRAMVVRNVETQYRSFKETIASLLSDSFHSIEPTEEMIRDRLTNLTLAIRDKTAVSRLAYSYNTLFVGGFKHAILYINKNQSLNTSLFYSST